MGTCGADVGWAAANRCEAFVRIAVCMAIGAIHTIGMAVCAISRYFFYWRTHYENCRVVGRK